MGAALTPAPDKLWQSLPVPAFLIGADGTLKEEWRGLKVPGHVEEVLKSVKALKKTA